MYRYRNSESNNSPKFVEKTQGGILIRFDIKEDIKEDITFYQYKEFWFDLKATDIEEVVNEKGFILTEEYKNIIEMKKLIKIRGCYPRYNQEVKKLKGINIKI